MAFMTDGYSRFNQDNIKSLAGGRDLDPLTNSLFVCERMRAAASQSLPVPCVMRLHLPEALLPWEGEEEDKKEEMSKISLPG